MGAPATVHAAATLTVTPITWNIIGLDSNNVNVGPQNFPVGARVCNTGDAVANNVAATLAWDTLNSYINIRPGSSNPLTKSNLAVNACTDFYFEVQVTRDAAAYDTTRNFHVEVTANGLGVTSTPTPRQLYVEHLISQSRNGITDVKLDSTSIPAGGSMTLVVGNTYNIQLVGFTATNGYNEFESFINFPNTIFQINSVNTTYTANSPGSPVSNPNDKLYADACTWDNVPTSPNYRSCIGGDYKTGGNVTMTYNVTIISGGGSSQTLSSLLYDFSGSSFHYNADYTTGFRIANIVDPTNVGIAKSFTPSSTTVNGISVLTITLSNPNPGPLSGYNFTDPLPAGLQVAATPSASTSGCGSPTFAPAAAATSLTFSNGTVAASSTCTISVNVTPTTAGPFNNTTNNLFINSLNTGKNASATLTTQTFPDPVPPSTCTQKVEIARWSMPTSGQGSGGPPPPYTSKVADVTTATAAASLTGAGSQSIVAGNTGQTNAWQIVDAWPSTTGAPGAVAPYFQFTLDTSKYGGITIQFDYDLEAGGDWASQTDNHFYIYTSANNGADTLVATISNVNKGSWLSIPITTSTNNGTGTTRFRITADSRNSSKSTATIRLDNIVFTGCPVPPNPPTIVKSFSPNPVAVSGGTVYESTLTFTITNPNAIGANYNNTLSGIAVSDTLPTGVVISSPPNTTNTCGGTVNATAGGSTISLTGGTLAANVAGNNTCTISVRVKATTAGPHNNVSGFISTSETGTNSTSTGFATANLVAVSPPSISKQFSPSTIVANGVSTLTFLITNPNQNNALSGVAFSDTLPTSPANMLIANPNGASNTCGGTLTATAGAGTLSLSGGSLTAGGTCTISVNVTAPTAGAYNNTSGNVSHIINSQTVNGNTAIASLSVRASSPSISLLKQVGTSSSGPWFKSLSTNTGTQLWYRFIVENTGDVALTLINLTDTMLSVSSCNSGWPSPLPVASASQDPTSTCVAGPISAAVGTHPNTATVNGTANNTQYTAQSSATYTASSPTSADLLAFKAGSAPKGIRVKWQTGNELEIIGFNVWRKTSKGTEWKKLNANLIDAKSVGTISSEKYSYLDKSVKVGKKYVYRIEIVLVQGEARWSDEISIRHKKSN